MDSTEGSVPVRGVEISGWPWVAPLNWAENPTIQRAYEKETYDFLVGLPSAGGYQNNPWGFMKLIVRCLGLTPDLMAYFSDCTATVCRAGSAEDPVCLCTGLSGWFIGLTTGDTLVIQDRSRVFPGYTSIYRRSRT